MGDKANLSLLIDLVGQLLENKENSWMIHELIGKIDAVCSPSELINNPVIQTIHEYCIEDVISSHANDFYKDFPLSDLKKELVRDFIKMEHERRRDNFIGYSISVYQQIEGIVNALFLSDDFRQRIKEDVTAKKVVFNCRNKETGNYEPRELIREIFYEVPDKEIGAYFDQDGYPVTDYRQGKIWSFLRKFKAVTYYYYFNGGYVNTSKWYDLYFTVRDLQYVRNKVHRDGVFEETKDQVNKTKKIEATKSLHYLKFGGLLSDYVAGVTKCSLKK